MCEKEANENTTELALDGTRTPVPRPLYPAMPPVKKTALTVPSVVAPLQHTQPDSQRSHALQITTIASIMPQARAIQHLTNPTTNPPTTTPYPHRQDHLSPKRTPWRHPLQWNHLSPSRDRGFPQGLEMFHGAVRQG
ncbi:hypothetical protein CCHR01_13949 [Colletotrichum chrysophilum]|uniref:Uncharacterized protein n=1 Tax=Colletotrichum chrysophilum TaxID=1836956 RepID=A0AAD9A904_9PEZI|nr:hypothetical protein CCHR01_13949 [Colletotrichum chrysophilum]